MDQQELAHHHDWRKSPHRGHHASEGSPWRIAPRAPSGRSGLFHSCRLAPGSRRTAPEASFRPETRAPSWQPPRWSRECPGRRPSRACRRFPTAPGSPWWWWTSARTSIATPDMLAQFAVMGDFYSRVILLRIIAIRASDCYPSARKNKKATSLPVRHPFLKGLPINFIGNVEGRDIYSGRRRDRLRRIRRQCGAEG